MFKSKSFDLVNEEKTKKPERLYQPRRMRWLKYIILPAVFAFVLLLILVNVDFSDNSEEVASNLTGLAMHMELMDTGGYVATEVITSGMGNSTEKISMVKEPELSGVTTTEASTHDPTLGTTNSTAEPTTSTVSSSSSTSTTEHSTSISSSSTTSSTSTTYEPTTEITTPITNSTLSTTTQSPNCDEELCEEYVCTVPQGESTATSVPYEMILKFKDLKSHTVQVAVSECEVSQVKVIYSTKNATIVSLDQESLEQIFRNITLGLDCGTPYIYCVTLGEKETSAAQCISQRTMTCKIYSSQTESWFEVHGGLVIGLGVLAILLSSLLGMLILYGTLRMKPSLLRGSNHQSNSSRDSNSVGLIPQESEKNEYGPARAPISTLDNNEYIVAYHRYLERANLRHMESNKYISPPRERAPSVPPSCDSPSSFLPLPLPARNVYESLDLYEELP